MGILEGKLGEKRARETRREVAGERIDSLTRATLPGIPSRMEISAIIGLLYEAKARCTPCTCALLCHGT